ncbi:C-X-C chemokine receptor type 5 [Rhineura floridana]|uniref:C-X-C chemokine receptor type 5 n=1 Tax=Rhineura floridana TaxID=261503 RepID=UPI002AC86DA3|nr:C-X-C chemokine receptor type 5 [Rhineura floridana]
MADSQIPGEYSVDMWNSDYSDNRSDYEQNYTNDYMCPAMDDSATHRFREFLVPFVYLLIFLLGALGNLLVIVILCCYRRSRSSTELFLFHLALANLLLVFTFPFGVVQNLAGWVFGTFLCKVLSATNRINFYSSSLLLGCVSVDRYLAVVYALQTFQKQRALCIHLTCLTVWLLSLLLAVPNLLFSDVWKHNNLSICHFMEFGEHGINAWLATRFLYHIVGFFLPSAVMCYCYTAIVRALCRSQRRQRQKAVKVAILVTSIFLLCWTPYHVIIFLDTLNKLGAGSEDCSAGLSTAIVVSEMVAFSHCCLNPILYAFVGIRFRHDACRVLNRLGCLSQTTMQEVLGTCSTESNISVTRQPSSPHPTNPFGTLPDSRACFSSPQALTEQMAQRTSVGLSLGKVTG